MIIPASLVNGLIQAFLKFEFPEATGALSVSGLQDQPSNIRDALNRRLKSSGLPRARLGADWVLQFMIILQACCLGIDSMG